MIAIDILHLVDRLEELVMEGRAIPFSTRVVMDEGRFLDIVDQMRVSIPEEIKKAKRIQQERERIIAQANEEASRIVSLAREEAENLVADHEIVKAADVRTSVILERAQNEAKQIRKDADSYVLDVLGQLEYHLDGLLTTVRNGLRRVQHSRQQTMTPEEAVQAVAEVTSEG
ncbi:MAG: ATPase [Anaerolineae bacterium]|nr:MAG: ATPase [Anaerolineae bacterium]